MITKDSSIVRIMPNAYGNPYVGIFWYDLEAHTLFGVRKEELTPERMGKPPMKDTSYR